MFLASSSLSFMAFNILTGGVVLAVERLRLLDLSVFALWRALDEERRNMSLSRHPWG
jgi:hypothetical protein